MTALPKMGPSSDLPVDTRKVTRVTILSAFCALASIIPFVADLLQKGTFGPAFVRLAYAALTGLSWPCFSASVGAGVRLLIQARLPFPSAVFPWRAHAFAATVACFGGLCLLMSAQAVWVYGLVKADGGWRIAVVILALWGLCTGALYAGNAVWGVVWAKEVGSEVSSSEGDVDVVSFQHEIVEMDGSRDVWPPGEETEPASKLDY